MIEPRTWTDAMNKLNQREYLVEVDENGREGRQFQRIVGGFAWPTHEPGFLVILGLDRHKSQAIGRSNIYVLAEHEDPSESNLLATMQQLSYPFYCRRWFSDPDHILARQYFQLWKVQGGKLAYFCDAPEVDDKDHFQLYTTVIRDLLRGENKVLVLGETAAKIRERLLQMPAELKQETAKSFPAILALGYALASLEIYRPTKRRATQAGYVPLDKVVGI